MRKLQFKGNERRMPACTWKHAEKMQIQVVGDLLGYRLIGIRAHAATSCN
jgi:hypothetical protein